MKINQITESTVAGSVATVAMPLGKVQERTIPAVKKSKKKYRNSLSEGKVKELSMDLKELTDAEFKKKYGKTKQEWSALLKKKDSEKPVSEAELQEDDLILVPGQGFKRRTGFVPHGQSRVDHEVEMARSDVLATMKNAKAIYELLKNRSEEEGIEGWVQEKLIKANDYLNAVKEYYDEKNMQHEMTGGVVAGGGVGENIAMESVGYENFKAIKHGAEEGRSAEIQLGGETIMLDYPEVRFLNMFIRKAQKENRLDSFIKLLSDPYVFHQFMKKRGDILYRNRDADSSQATADRLGQPAMVAEKAVSKQQQKFMGMVHAVQKGEMKAPSKAVAKAAKGMTKKAGHEFAATKHKGLPDKVKKDKK